MIVKTVPVRGVISELAYFYVDENTKHGFLIDPGNEPKKLASVIKSNGWTIDKILLTHGHFDHIGAVDALREQFDIPVFAYEKAVEYLTDPGWNLSSLYATPMTVENVEFLSEDAMITSENMPYATLRVIPTPGHTIDSVIYHDAANGLAFVGDTIFRNSIGSVEHPGGDYETERKSIEEKIFTLPAETILYSGHTAPTTVGRERGDKSVFDIIDEEGTEN